MNNYKKQLTEKGPMVDGDNGEHYNLQSCDIGGYAVIQWGANCLGVGDTEIEAVEKYISIAGEFFIGHDEDNDEPIFSSDPQAVLSHLRKQRRQDGEVTIERVCASE